MDENMDDSIANIFDEVKQLLPENSDTLEQVNLQTENKNDFSQSSVLIEQSESVAPLSQDSVQSILDNIIEEKETAIIQQVEAQQASEHERLAELPQTYKPTNVDTGESKNDYIFPPLESNKDTKPQPTTVEGILDNIVEEQETDLIKQIESEQEVQGILDNIVEEKEAKIIEQEESKQEVQGILDNIVEEQETDLIKQIESEQQNKINQSVSPNINVKVLPENKQVSQNIIQPKNETNNILNNIQPEKTLLQKITTPQDTNQQKDLLTPTDSNINLNKPLQTNVFDLNNQETTSLVPPAKTTNLLDKDIQNLDLNTNNIYTKDTNKQQSLFNEEQIIKQQPLFNEEQIIDLFNNLQPQVEDTIAYETASELPSTELYSQVEDTTDKNSEEILANTEKTNTTLQALTQLLASFIQATGGQQGQTQIPVPVPVGQSNSGSSGTTDASQTAQQGMISSIRNKFMYSV